MHYHVQNVLDVAENIVHVGFVGFVSSVYLYCLDLLCGFVRCNVRLQKGVPVFQIATARATVMYIGGSELTMFTLRVITACVQFYSLSTLY